MVAEILNPSEYATAIYLHILTTVYLLKQYFIVISSVFLLFLEAVVIYLYRRKYKQPLWKIKILQH